MRCKTCKTTESKYWFAHKTTLQIACLECATRADERALGEAAAVTDATLWNLLP